MSTSFLPPSRHIPPAARSGYYVCGNMFVHYEPTNTRRSRGPDFFLVLDVDDRERKSWVVWQDGMRFPM